MDSPHDEMDRSKLQRAADVNTAVLMGSRQHALDTIDAMDKSDERLLELQNRLAAELPVCTNPARSRKLEMAYLSVVDRRALIAKCRGMARVLVEGLPVGGPKPQNGGADAQPRPEATPPAEGAPV
jgi:hypothetical protein